MRTLSPIRSVSPGPKPKIVFNYQPSPLRERPSTTNLTPNGKQYLPFVMISPTQNLKTSNFTANTDISIQNRCLSCPKQAFYRVVKDGKIYCSTCAIEIMKKGCEVVRIELKDQRFYKEYQEKNEKENTHPVAPLSPKVKEFTQMKNPPANTREDDLNDLLAHIDRQQQQLSRLLEKFNSEQLTSSGIKAIYHQKKLGLKRHYEKIKAVIKQSIEKDLQELERREKSSLKCIQQKKQELKDDIFLLQQIKKDVQPNKMAIITVIEEQDYRKMLKQHREDTKSILQNKEVSLRLINELSSHQLNHTMTESQQVRHTEEQITLSKGVELYDPYTYTLIDCKHKKGETLFSFQGNLK